MELPEMTFDSCVDCDGNPYFTVRYNGYGIIGGGDTFEEAIEEAIYNLGFLHECDII